MSFVPPRRLPRRLAEPAALLAALGVLYWPCLRVGSLTTGGDMANLFFPLFTWVQGTISRDGVWPLWNPYLFGGHPGAAAAQSAVFYPPGRVVYAVFGGAPVAAMNLFLLLHLLWAGIGAWAFARSRAGLGLRGFGPWCAGFAFAGCAWWWGQIEHAAALATTSWLPWLVLWGGHVAEKRSGVRETGVFGLIVALQLLAGHPQEAFYSLMAAAGWALWRAASGRGRQRIRHFACGLWKIVVGCALAGLLAAVQLLPTFELGARSYRRFDDLDYAAAFSMPPRLLALLLSPHAFGSYAEGHAEPMAFGEYGIHVGVPVVLLAGFAWGLDRLRRKSRGMKRRASAFWAGAAVAALLLALGGHADLRRLIAPSLVDAARTAEFPEAGWSPLALLATLVPPVRHFRVPARILVVWSFAATMLGAVGIQYMECLIYRAARRGRPGGRDSRGSRNARGAKPAVLIAGWLCAAAVFLSLFLPSLKERMAFQADYGEALDLAEGRRPAIPPGAPLENRLFRLTLLDDELLARDGAAPRASEGEADLESRVALRAAILAPDLNLLSGQALSYGYEEGLLPTVRYKDFLFTYNKSLRDADPDARLLALGGVRWLWSELPIRSERWERVESGWGRSPGALYRNRLWRGAAFDKAEFPGVEWEKLDGTWQREGRLMGRRHQERLGYAIPSEAPALPPGASLPAWGVRLADANSLIVHPRDADAGTTWSGRLVVAQATYPGWVARDADGSPLSTRVLNAWNTEVESRRGATPIRFAYEPWSFRVGAFVSCLAAAILAGLMGVRMKQSDEDRRGDAETRPPMGNRPEQTTPP